MRDWKYISFMAIEDNQCRMLEKNLLDPSLTRWPDSEDELETAYNEIEASLTDDLKPLFKLSLFSSLLVKNSPGQDTARKWAVNKLDPKSFLPGIDWKTKGHALHAAAVPVAVTRQHTAEIIFFIIIKKPSLNATGASFPHWINNSLDNSALKAAKDAINVAKGQCRKEGAGLYIYPVLNFEKNCSPITGRSLALPVSLGCMAVLMDQKLYNRMVATGDIQQQSSGNWQISGVGGVKEKAQAAREADFMLFLFPRENLGQVQDIDVQGLHLKPVTDLREAWRWARFFAPGQEKDLRFLDAALVDAHGFISNITNLPSDYIEYAVNEADCFFDHIVRDRDLASSFITQLEDCYYKQRDYGKLEILGKAFIENKQRIETMGESSPASAFQLCSLMFKQVTHSGNMAKADMWKEEALLFIEEARESRPRAVISFLNSCVVDARHNRYDFREELPNFFLKEIEDRERIRGIKKRKTDECLGRLYATMAQNYGFCRMTDQCIEAANLAMEAFGGGKVQEFTRDWQRQYCYKLYAYLDAGLKKEARKALISYLPINSLDARSLDYLDELDSFQQAALIRYLADTAADTHTKSIWKAVKQKLLSHVYNQATSAHPWQLWTYNLGRLLHLDGDKETAIRAWNKSIRLARAIEGETATAMALLPLSALQKIGEKVSREDVEAALEAARNFPVFEQLVTLASSKALEEVAQNPKYFFPFTYR